MLVSFIQKTNNSLTLTALDAHIFTQYSIHFKFIGTAI